MSRIGCFPYLAILLCRNACPRTQIAPSLELRTGKAQGQEAEGVGEHSRAPTAVEGQGVSRDSSNGMGSKSVGAETRWRAEKRGSATWVSLGYVDDSGATCT